MNNNMESEILKRLKNEEWDKSISSRVLFRKKIQNAKIISTFSIILISLSLIFYNVNPTKYAISNYFQNEEDIFISSIEIIDIGNFIED